MAHRYPSVVMALNSDPAVGALPMPTLGPTGFSIQLAPAVVLDPDRNWSAQLIAAQVPYTITNVSGVQGNNHFIYDLLDAGGSILATRTLTIPDGIYGVDTLSLELTGLAVAAGDYPDASPEPPQPLFNVIGNFSNNTVTFQVTAAPNSAAFPGAVAWRIHTGPAAPSPTATPFVSLMGFTSNTFLSTNGLTPPADFPATGLANFPNGITGLQLHLSIVSGSYGPKGGAGDMLAPIPLNGVPGSFLDIEPKIPVNVPVGSKAFSSISAYLTDQTGAPIPSLQLQAYNFTFQIVDNGATGGVREDRAWAKRERLTPH